MEVIAQILSMYIWSSSLPNYVFHREGIVDINHLLLPRLLCFAVYYLTPKPATQWPHSGGAWLPARSFWPSCFYESSCWSFLPQNTWSFLWQCILRPSPPSHSSPSSWHGRAGSREAPAWYTKLSAPVSCWLHSRWPQSHPYLRVLKQGRPYSLIWGSTTVLLTTLKTSNNGNQQAWIEDECQKFLWGKKICNWLYLF